MSTMYELFATNQDMEKEGIYVDYGSFRVKIARAGGNNKAYARVLENKTKPFRRAIQMQTMDNDRAMDIIKEAYAETVVLNWEVKQEDGSWAQGIEGPNDDLLPFEVANVVNIFTELPDLFSDIQQQANLVSLFMEEKLGDEAKN